MAINPSSEGQSGRGGVRAGTKHRELTAALREMVAGMRPGDRLPTQEELMRRFDVSDTTVLRSLGDLQREGRIIRRQGSGTFVSENISSPPETTSPRARGMVAVMAAQSGNLFFSEMIEAVEGSLFHHDMAPVLIMDRDMDRRMRRTVDYWERGDVIGAIHIGSAPLSAMSGMPAILVGESYQDRDFCQVSLDNNAAGRLVGEYLWDLGHRRLAVVTLQKSPHQPLLQGVDHIRVSGLRTLWEERGGEWSEEAYIAHPMLLQPDDGRAVQVMRSYLEPLFQGADAPTAVFAAHDEMAAVVIRALEGLGLRVPEDVSVVGFNDLGMLAAYFRPSLTTVRTPAATLGTLAVHQLLDLLQHPDRRPRSIRLPSEIIVRESTAPPPTARGGFARSSLSSLAPSASTEITPGSA